METDKVQHNRGVTAFSGPYKTVGQCYITHTTQITVEERTVSHEIGHQHIYHSLHLQERKNAKGILHKCRTDNMLPIYSNAAKFKAFSVRDNLYLISKANV